MNVWAHRLLVSHANVPVWERAKLKSAGADIPKLYHSTNTPDYPDALEDWLSRDVENPAIGPLEQLINGRGLSPSDAAAVLRYVIALEHRTPANYLRSTERWKVQLPGMLDSVMQRTKRTLRRAKRLGGSLQVPPPEAPPAAPLVKVTIGSADAHGLVPVRADIKLGRELWLFSLQHVVNQTVMIIPPLTWSIIRPFGDSEWFTTDDPVIRLAYQDEANYHFEGGWGRPKSEILLPLSPTDLLYTKVGQVSERVIEATRGQTFEFQRMLAYRAFRSIYARTPQPRIQWFRQRHVNRTQFEQERDQMQRWDELQSD